jgi:hypothetical protein
MDRLPSIGSPLPALPPRAPAPPDAEASMFAALMSPGEPDHAAPLLEALKGGDPATQQQRIAHFTSHVSAECFIALLKTMDPMPDDYQARAEYKRFYRQMHEVLEIPLPPAEPQPIAGAPVDPLR